jgi:hypothetical protein
MKLVTQSISVSELSQLASKMYGELVKAVVDIKQQIMIVDAELHADEEKELLSQGSRQQDLWGINLYPQFYGSDDFIEFDSMINVRPNQNNSSRDVIDPQIRSTISQIVAKLVTD